MGRGRAISLMTWPATRGMTTKGTPSHCGSVTSSGVAMGTPAASAACCAMVCSREVVVAKRSGGRWRQAHDEGVGLVAFGTRPHEVDENRLARIPDGRMLRVDDAHVPDAGPRRGPARQRGGDDQRVTMGQERHAEPLGTVTFVTVVVTP